MPPRDELTGIKGIGEATATWLSETFGVRTTGELAALDADAVEAELAVRGRAGVSRAAVDGWIAEAAGKAAPADGPPPRPPTNGWGPVASFVVEFQRRDGAGGPPERISVHHLEEDSTEILVGSDPEALYSWMTARLPPDDPVPATHPGAGGARVGGEPAVVQLRAGVEPPAEPLPLDGEWAVRFDWNVGGVPLPAGTWSLDVILQPVRGRDRPVRLRDEPVRVPGPAGTTSFSERYTVPAQALPAELADTLLRGTAMLTFRSVDSGRPVVACVADLGVVQFWDALAPSGRVAER